MTLAADFKITENEQSTLQIWDTAGTERYVNLGIVFYRNADIAILLYDVTRPETLEALAQHKQRIEAEYNDHETKPVFILIGNKLDLAKETEQAISDEDAMAFAKAHNIHKTNHRQIAANNPEQIKQLKAGLFTLAADIHGIELPNNHSESDTDSSSASDTYSSSESDSESYSNSDSETYSDSSTEEASAQESNKQSIWPSLLVAGLIVATTAILATVFWPSIIALPLLATAATATGIAAPVIAGVSIATLGTVLAATAGKLASVFTSKAVPESKPLLQDVNANEQGAMMFTKLSVNPKANQQPTPINTPEPLPDDANATRTPSLTQEKTKSAGHSPRF